MPPIRISLGIAIVNAAVTLAAQNSPTFDVASVKPNRTGELMIRTDTQPGGRFIAVNATLTTLLQLAYGLEGFDIVGAPAWASSDHFDIDARARRELPPLEGPTRGSPALQEMLRGLLRDRFSLAAHTETRERDAFALTIAEKDGRTGPRLAASTVDCAALFAAVKPDGDRPACGLRMSPGSIVLEGLPLSQLASSLAPMLGKPVLDRTGLTGNFDLQLSWDPPMPGGGAVRPDAVSLFTALGDQAGLRLVAMRATATVLVIDSVRTPTAN